MRGVLEVRIWGRRRRNSAAMLQPQLFQFETVLAVANDPKLTGASAEKE
jgi:hypothetical protein